MSMAGCVDVLGGSEDIQDTDGDGVIDSEDYAPRDPDVQQRSDLTEQGGGDDCRCPTQSDQDDSSGTGETVPPDSAALYTFEGQGDGITDQTGNGHDGQRRQTTRVDARSGRALRINRGEYATVAAAESLNPGDQSYTTSLWFRSESVPSGNYNGRQGLLIKRRESEATRWHLILHEDMVQLDFNDGSNGGRVRSKSGLTDSEWHQTVAVWDTETVTLYVDGQRQEQQAVQVGSIVPRSPIYLGAQPEYPNPLYFDGRIDDVAVYARALSPEEVQRLYAAQRV